MLAGGTGSLEFRIAEGIVMDGMALRNQNITFLVSKWDRRILENKRRRRAQMKRHIFQTVFAAMFLGIALLCANSMSSKAEEEKRGDVPAKYYKNICVGQGETLTSIARLYADKEHYGTLSEYIEEVAYMNHLENVDDIRAGYYLIIPYYAKQHHKI